MLSSREAALHVQATSTGTANVQTIAIPTNRLIIGCFISATTNGAQVTFDGTTPATTNGLVLATGQVYFFPFVEDVKFVSTAAANSVVNLVWVT